MNSTGDKDIVISKATMDQFLKTDMPADLIALYGFYYYTAIWQKTNTAKATRSYAMKGLKWGRKRFDEAYKKLVELGLVKTIVRRSQTGQILGTYIELPYIRRSENTVSDSDNPLASKEASGFSASKNQEHQKPPVDTATSGSQTINAYSAGIVNAYNANKESTLLEENYSLEAITAFVRDNGLNVKPDIFYQHYSNRQWLDGYGKPINVQIKLKDWHDRERTPKQKPKQKTNKKEDFQSEDSKYGIDIAV